MAAFDLIETSPFPTEAFSFSTTDRTGFTFDSSVPETDFDSWKADFESKLPNLMTLDISPSFSSNIASSANIPYSTPYSGGGLSAMDSFGNVLMGIKSKGDKALKTGYALKTAAAAGELFNSIFNYAYTRSIASKTAANKKQSVENQMLALDNQVLYYKNQITDKFANAIARNTVTMAAKNLRVTAGSLLEQTKDAAYDATKDIEMLESNAELKKIALRSEAKQADVVKKLSKSLATANLISSVGKLGLVIGGGVEAGVFGNLFSSGEGSLNEMVYGQESVSKAVYGE